MALDESGTLFLRVSSDDWLGSLLGMRDVLQRDLAQIAGVPLRRLELQVKRLETARSVRPAASRSGAAASFRPRPSTPNRKGSFIERP